MLKYIVFIAMVAAGAWYGGGQMGISWKDFSGKLPAMFSDTLTRDFEWEAESLENEAGFAFDWPQGWRLEKGDRQAVMTEEETGEQVKIRLEEGEMITLAEASQGKAEIVSGAEAVVVSGGSESEDKAYIPVGDGKMVVVEGKGDAFEETYRRVDLTPNEPDWKILGLEEPETERIMEKLDEYLEKIVPDEDKNSEIQGKLIVRIMEEPFAYVTYSDGETEKTLVINVEKFNDELPIIAGYYNYPLVKSGNRWIIQGNDNPIAILPDSAEGFAK